MKSDPLRLALICGFLLVICAPGLMMVATGRTGGGALYGEAEAEHPVFSFASWLDRTYQRDFEAWFSRRYPGRSRAVRAYNSIRDSGAAVEERITGAGRTSILSAGNKAETIAALLDERERFASPGYPEYIRNVPRIANQSPFRGAGDTVVGKSGVLYQNNYINEVFGFAPKYANAADGTMRERARKLRVIQDELRRRGIAFSVLITPNKAAQYVEYVPDWYLNMYTMPEGYVRPYTRFLAMLGEAGVDFVDGASVLKENGITNSFPMTGTHWTLLAALPATQKLVDSYMKQTGIKTRQVRITGFRHSRESRFREQDIYEVLYSGRAVEQERAPADPEYVYPEVELVDASLPPIDGVWFQGGSFIEEVKHWLSQAGLAGEVSWHLYDQARHSDWSGLLGSVSYVILEVNEQFVYNMGSSWLPFGEADFDPVPENQYNVIDNLYNYLTGADNDRQFYLPDVKREYHDDAGPEEHHAEYDRKNILPPPVPAAPEDGTDAIIVGRDGMLFDNAYINEYFGLAPKYTNAGDETLRKKVDRLAVIERDLKKRDIAFTLLITPSKASQYPDHIPAWYLAKHSLPEGYVRPYERLLPMLRERGIAHIDSAKLLAGLGITNTFPYSGTAWNHIASLEASKALIAEYEEQRKQSLWHLRTVGVEKTRDPFSYSVFDTLYDSDQNLLDQIYPEGSERHEKAADRWYFRPMVTITNEKGTRIPGMLLQGGGFLDDVTYWIGQHEIAWGMQRYFYNRPVEDWEALLGNVAFVVIEVNEQNVYNIGGSQPGMGEYDAIGPAAGEYNFVDDLYRHLGEGRK